MLKRGCGGLISYDPIYKFPERSNKNYSGDLDELLQRKEAMLKGGELPACQSMCGKKVKDWASRFCLSCVAEGGLLCYIGLEFAKAEQDITDSGRRSIYSLESKKHCDEHRKHEVIRIWHLQRREKRGLHCKGPQMHELDGRWEVCSSCKLATMEEPTGEKPEPKRRKVGEWPACRNSCGNAIMAPHLRYCGQCWLNPGELVVKLGELLDRDEFQQRREAMRSGAERPLCQSMCGKKVKDWHSRFCVSCVAKGGLLCRTGQQFAKIEQQIRDGDRSDWSGRSHLKYEIYGPGHFFLTPKFIRRWHLRRRQEYGMRCQGPQMIWSCAWDQCRSCKFVLKGKFYKKLPPDTSHLAGALGGQLGGKYGKIGGELGGNNNLSTEKRKENGKLGGNTNNLSQEQRKDRKL